MTAVLRPGAGRALQAFGLPPDEIMPLSLERLRQRSPVELPPPPAETVMLRMAYAAGDADMLAAIVAPQDAVHAAVEVLRRGSPLICDVAMVAAGVHAAVERAGSRVLCAQDAPRSPDAASPLSLATRTAVRASTRTAQGMLALAEHWRDAVVAIGNAPTALLAVLDAIADGAPAPAVLIATPCGLVAAGEAKQLALDAALCPVITVRGARGGSPVAAAAVNACALLAVDTLVQRT